MKKCKSCKKSKHLTDFYVSYIRKGRTQLKTSCKECDKVKAHIWSKENKEKRRFIRIKNKYSVSLIEYNNMLAQQENKCAICKENFLDRKIDVDHCHSSGKVRGLLCHGCNTALGFVKDNINTLTNAITYLRKHG